MNRLAPPVLAEQTITVRSAQTTAMHSSIVGHSHSAADMQAVVVEAQGAAWYAAEVSAVGRQGLLPKLDVVLLVNHFLRGQLRLHTRLPRRRPALLEQLKAALPPPAIKQQQRYLALLDGMASFMAMQVGGLPDGAHAAFKEYAVDAVTARMLSVRPQTPLPCHLQPHREP